MARIKASWQGRVLLHSFRCKQTTLLRSNQKAAPLIVLSCLSPSHPSRNYNDKQDAVDSVFDRDHRTYSYSHPLPRRLLG